MQLLKYSRDITFPKGCDYIFEKVKDLEKKLKYLRPKLEGEWIIVCVDFNLKEMREIKENFKIPDYVDIRCYVKQEVIEKFLIEYPEYAEVEVSKWDQYLELVKTLEKPMSKSAMNELYKRNKGNLEKIRGVLPDIINAAEEKEIIDIKDINNYVLKEEKTYARDVILSFLLRGNENIPRKGNRLSKFRYGNPWDYYYSLVDEYGEKTSYYFLRKSVNKLFEQKLNYLRNEDIKEEEFVKAVDYFHIVYLKDLFVMCTKPDQLIIIFRMLERRNNNACIFEETFLT